MKRALFFAYGVLSYLFVLATVLYGVAFVGDVAVVKTVDVPAQEDLATAAGFDLALIALFGIQHSVMARAAFKRFWTRVVPEPIERSTYVLAASLTLAFLRRARPRRGARERLSRVSCPRARAFAVAEVTTTATGYFPRPAPS